jgi:hypothetical protein
MVCVAAGGEWTMNMTDDHKLQAYRDVEGGNISAGRADSLWVHVAFT